MAGYGTPLLRWNGAGGDEIYIFILAVGSRGLTFVIGPLS